MESDTDTRTFVLQDQSDPSKGYYSPKAIDQVVPEWQDAWTILGIELAIEGCEKLHRYGIGNFYPVPLPK